MPRSRRLASQDDPLTPHDPAVIAHGYHRPLAYLCPSVEITALEDQPPSQSHAQNCGPKCEFDSDCPEKGQLCCSTVCGTRSCLHPMKSTQTGASSSGKPGTSSSLSELFEEKAGSGANLFCGRYICSNRETCVTVAQRSCKPTSIDFACPTVQQCQPAGEFS